MGQQVFDEPLQVEAVDGEVVVTGPGGARGSFTPRAAVESATRLVEAASRATAQSGADLRRRSRLRRPAENPLGGET